MALLWFLAYTLVLFGVAYRQEQLSREVQAGLQQFVRAVQVHQKAVEDYAMRVEVLRDLLNRMEDQRAKHG